MTRPSTAHEAAYVDLPLQNLVARVEDMRVSRSNLATEQRLASCCRFHGRLSPGLLAHADL